MKNKIVSICLLIVSFFQLSAEPFNKSCSSAFCQSLSIESLKQWIVQLSKSLNKELPKDSKKRLKHLILSLDTAIQKSKKNVICIDDNVQILFQPRAGDVYKAVLAFNDIAEHDGNLSSKDAKLLAGDMAVVCDLLSEVADIIDSQLIGDGLRLNQDVV